MKTDQMRLADRAAVTGTKTSGWDECTWQNGQCLAPYTFQMRQRGTAEAISLHLCHTAQGVDMPVSNGRPMQVTAQARL
jgi:hypothetical protein